MTVSSSSGLAALPAEPAAAPPGVVVELFDAVEVAGRAGIFCWVAADGGELELAAVPAFGSAAGTAGGDCAGVVGGFSAGGGADCCGGNFVADGAVGNCCSVGFWAASPHGSAVSKTRITQVLIRCFIISVSRFGRPIAANRPWSCLAR
jgi:hypothetical protein